MHRLILHEIGHTLEDLLQQPIGWLVSSIHENFGKPGVKTELEKISPCYLGSQQKAICAAFQKGKPTRESRTRLANEVAAEIIRHYYLEPILLKKPAKETKTGWDDLDNFIHLLGRETRITLHQSSPRPLFPASRKKKEPKLIEFAKDLAL